MKKQSTDQAIKQATNLLHLSKFEIQRLRRDNEILNAQVSVMEIFAVALGMKGNERPQTVDVIWQIDNAIKELEKQDVDQTT